MAATYPPVPAPTTTTSYSLVKGSFLQGRERHEGGRPGCRRRRRCTRGRCRSLRLTFKPADASTQLAIVVAQLPIGFREPVELSGYPASPEDREQSHQQRAAGSQPL